MEVYPAADLVRQFRGQCPKGRRCQRSALFAEALLSVTKLVQCRDEMFNAYVVVGHHRPDIHMKTTTTVHFQ